MGYVNSMELIGSKGTYHDSGNGRAHCTPSIVTEPREQELMPNNGPFMKILTGNLSRKPAISTPVTQHPALG
jgi:hypothetical protein